eukprot:XP_028343083.1 interferon alpha-inducible protein 6-like isoform X1 [Physeter catodon]
MFFRFPVKAAAAVAGGALAVGAVPVVLGAVGFTGAGIAASSLAAKMMSAAAVANGGGVAAGSLVATLQSGAEVVPSGAGRTYSGHPRIPETSGFSWLSPCPCGSRGPCLLSGVPSVRSWAYPLLTMFLHTGAQRAAG